MTNYWNLLRRRLFAPAPKTDAEVERITALQQTAATRRAEFAVEKERAALTGDVSPPAALSSSRERMEEAEFAYTAALQTWENKQSRQKSR